jgi:hypothetical protein
MRFPKRLKINKTPRYGRQLSVHYPKSAQRLAFGRLCQTV